MNSRAETIVSIAMLGLLCLMLPSAASADVSASLQINGTCVTGVGLACPVGSPLTVETSVSGSGTKVIMLGDGDTYAVSWGFFDGFPSGWSIGFAPIVTYIGTAPSVANDVITADLIQSYLNPNFLNWDGGYSEAITAFVSPGVGPGSSASGFLQVDAQALPTFTQYGPGLTTGAASASLSGLDGDTLTMSVPYTFVFGAATVPGANEASYAVPEPVETLPAVLGFAWLAFAACRLIARRNAR